MSTSVSMPALGESVSEGTVTRWLKHEGDRVEADEPLLEVSTDKVDTEIPSPAAGVLQKILVSEDETVAVGAELAVIGEGSVDTGDSAGASGSDDAQSQQPDGQAQGEQPPTAGQDQQGSPPEQYEEASAPAQSGAQYPAAPADVPQPSEQPQQLGDGGERSGAQPPQQPSPAEQAPADAARAPAAAESESDGAASGDAASGDDASGRDASGRDASGRDASARDGSRGDAPGGGGTPVTMPALGESVTEGTITRWLKSEGDQVAADEALLEVSTDKVDTEIPAPAAGVLQKILVGEDETVAVGTELAVIGSGGEGDDQQTPDRAEPSREADTSSEQAPPQQAERAHQGSSEQGSSQQAPPDEASRQQAPPQQAPPQQAPPQQAPPEQAPPQQAQEPRAGSDGDSNAYVTPLVRKLASERGVDLSTLTGTGVGGRIRKQDVVEAAAKRSQEREPARAAESGQEEPPSPSALPISPLRGTTEKMSRLRKVIAQRMVESLQVSAQLTSVVEVDLTRIARLRTRAKADFEAREHVKLSFLPFLAKATIEALKAHPKLNASVDIDKGEITYYDAEHLGVAVDTERGLLVPVVKNAGDLNIAGLARKVADLAERARNNKITPDELGGGTFTLTNTGSRGALFDTPIINQPQVGILGTGAVVKRPVVVDDPDLGETIAIRSMCYLALSYDHRLVDGADAARFLTTVKQRLEDGRFESDLGL